MLSDRGSFSCFFRHSTEAAPSCPEWAAVSLLHPPFQGGWGVTYERSFSVTYERSFSVTCERSFGNNKSPNLLRKAGWGNYDRFCFHQKISECELEWILLESIEYSA